MTLLEAVIAFVILSVVGVVCLDQSRGAARLEAASAEWTAAVARGESALAQAAGDAPVDMASMALSPTAVRVERRPWRRGMDQITVSVPLSGGATYRITRLVPNATLVTQR